MPTVFSKMSDESAYHEDRNQPLENPAECKKEEVLEVKPGSIHGWLITDRDEQPIIGRDKITGDEVAQDVAGNCHNARTGECVPEKNICSYE